MSRAVRAQSPKCVRQVRSRRSEFFFQFPNSCYRFIVRGFHVINSRDLLDVLLQVSFGSARSSAPFRPAYPLVVARGRHSVP